MKKNKEKNSICLWKRLVFSWRLSRQGKKERKEDWEILKKRLEENLLQESEKRLLPKD